MDREELATSKMSAGGRTHSVPPFSLDLSVQVNLFSETYCLPLCSHYFAATNQTSDTVHVFVVILFQFERGSVSAALY